MTQTVPDISPLMPMHQDPLLVCLLRCIKLNWIELELKENELNWNWIERFWIQFELELNWIEKSRIQLELELNWIERNELIWALHVNLSSTTTLIVCLAGNVVSLESMTHGLYMYPKFYIMAATISSELFLTHVPLVPHICISELGQHWLR